MPVFYKQAHFRPVPAPVGPLVIKVEMPIPPKPVRKEDPFLPASLKLEQDGPEFPGELDPLHRVVTGRVKLQEAARHVENIITRIDLPDTSIVEQRRLFAEAETRLNHLHAEIQAMVDAIRVRSRLLNKPRGAEADAGLSLQKDEVLDLRNNIQMLAMALRMKVADVRRRRNLKPSRPVPVPKETQKRWVYQIDEPCCYEHCKLGNLPDKGSPESPQFFEALDNWAYEQALLLKQKEDEAAKTGEGHETAETVDTEMVDA
ncbi:Uu.00g115680.m01.CDS01 [Anthostomella pinea]|uniref:Uu.00g115680.m01.CDS01 n=1 Tax=Anthostomella pinea TaxID=933095 RepID=A0AAI8VFV2_9PEZI|nr:Uu.00g115680.m01.CDS01 [Anthostomella pinea]